MWQNVAGYHATLPRRQRGLYVGLEPSKVEMRVTEEFSSSL